MEDTIVLSRFLPNTIPLQLDTWPFDHTATLLTLRVTSTPRGVPCPVCTVFTHRVHSGYTRLLADLPWGIARVPWQLRVRKFLWGGGHPLESTLGPYGEPPYAPTHGPSPATPMRQHTTSPRC